jgi:hypothetical protein
MADIFTIRERKGDLRRVVAAFVGDGNNVAHSLMLAAASSLWRATASSRPRRRRGPARGSRSGTIRSPRSATRTSSTRTCGRAWGRSRSTSAGAAPSRASS